MELRAVCPAPGTMKERRERRKWKVIFKKLVFVKIVYVLVTIETYLFKVLVSFGIGNFLTQIYSVYVNVHPVTNH